eukprot:tig00000555_g2130.t1
MLTSFSRDPQRRVTRQNNRDNRFLEHDELRFAIRSILLHASWTRNIYIVSDAQRPGWLSLPEGAAHAVFTGPDGRERTVRVVDHRDIFADAAALPVFNSFTIESQLHRIPGLSGRALFLNDDFFLGGPFRLADLWRPDRGARLLLERELPVGSPAERDSRSPADRSLGAGAEIDASADELGPAQLDPEGPGTSASSGNSNEPAEISEWTALDNSNGLLDERFGQAQRAYVSHMPRPVEVAVLREMEATWPGAWRAQAKRRFRSAGDLHTFFLAPHFLVERFAEEALRAVVASVWDANGDGRLCPSELRGAARDLGARAGRHLRGEAWEMDPLHAEAALAQYIADLEAAAAAGPGPGPADPARGVFAAVAGRYRGAPWLAELAPREAEVDRDDAAAARSGCVSVWAALAVAPRWAVHGASSLYREVLFGPEAEGRWPLLGRYRTSAETDWPEAEPLEPGPVHVAEEDGESEPDPEPAPEQEEDGEWGEDSEGVEEGVDIVDGESEAEPEPEAPPKAGTSLFSRFLGRARALVGRPARARPDGILRSKRPNLAPKRDPRLFHTQFLTLTHATTDFMLDAKMEAIAKEKPTFFCVNDDLADSGRGGGAGGSGGVQWRLEAGVYRLVPVPSGDADPGSDAEADGAVAGAAGSCDSPACSALLGRLSEWLRRLFPAPAPFEVEQPTAGPSSAGRIGLDL